jgi:CelD/BcsL family acetyltransferase involved in cellulose biosynthesis
MVRIKAMSNTDVSEAELIPSVSCETSPAIGVGSTQQSERSSTQEAPSRHLHRTQEAVDLRVNVVTTLAGLRELRPDYERLQQLTGNTLPFALHEWHLTWCEHFLEVDKPLNAQPMVYTIREASSGTCVAIVPMILTRRTLGPWVVGALDMLGPDPAITEIRIPLIAPGYEARAAHALQRQVGAERDWDWIRWTGIDSAFGRALMLDADVRWGEPLLCYVLDLPGSWQQLHAGLKRNIRESLRHGYNSLKRDGLEFELLVAQEPGAVKSGIDRFLDLHAMRANLSETVAHANRFAGASVRTFLYDVCARLAERGAARVYQLVIGGEIVAARIGFVVGNSLYLYYSGFDPAWGKYGVMTTALAESIKHAIAEGLATVNLSTGTDVSKTRWGPRTVSFGEAVQVARSLKSQLAYSVYQHARSGATQDTWMANLLRKGRRNWS